MDSAVYDTASGQVALSEAPKSHALVKDIQLTGLVQDLRASALAYANLIVFSALLFCLFGMSASPAIGYVLTGFALLLIVLLLCKPIVRKLSPVWAVAVLGISCELTLGSILAFDWFAPQRAQLIPAIAIVASLSFISVPLIAHFIKPFLATKFALILLCIYYVMISPDPIIKSVAIAALLIALLLMAAMGYWLIRRRREDIRLRLLLMDLNQVTAEQNEKLERSLEEIKAAKLKAEEDYALRQRLLSYIGHDVRQPINAATYILRALSKRNQDPKLDELITDTQDCLRSTGAMISDVVQITNYDNPKIEVELEPVSLGPVISQIVREFTDSAHKAESEIRFVPTSLWCVFDEELLLRIVRNLMRNAIKHSGASDILIGVRRAERHACLCIADNGSGLAEGPSKTRGLGLGLQISQQLARACKGQLTVRSEAGRGTMCVIQLPLAAAE